MIFATPDFGTGAALSLCLAIVYATVFGLVVVGVLWRTRLLEKSLPTARKFGVFLMLACGVAPLFCCLAPPIAVRIVYGNYPIGRYPNKEIQDGMSADEVQATLGRAHERCTQHDGEQWYYWIDAYGIRWFCVRFGPEGRVTGTHGN